MEFVHKEIVRLYDTDAQGVVHYASYYRFFTDALEEFRKSKLPSYSLTKNDVTFVTVESHAEYIKPAYLGDELEVRLSQKLLSEKAIRFDMKVYRHSELICKGYTIQVAVARKKWHAVRIPNTFLKALK